MADKKPLPITYYNESWFGIVKPAHRKLLKPALEYTYEFWTEGPLHKQKREGTASGVDATGLFQAGWIVRLKHYATERGYKVVLTEPPTKKIEAILPNVKGITFRDDQMFCLNRVARRQRGLFEAPTGSGKTIIMMGICSMYPTQNILIIVPSKDLLYQTVKELMARFPHEAIGMIGDGIHTMNRITVGIINSLKKLTKEVIESIKVVIVDEAHRVSRGGTYDETMQRMINASIRIGLTATIPKGDLKQETKAMYLEGAFGEVLGKVPFEQLQKEGVLARPIIYLLQPPTIKDLNLISDYRMAYSRGISRNKERNEMIIDVAFHLWSSKKKSTLIIIHELAHGKSLQKQFIDRGYDARFVKGSTSSRDRKKIKELLETKHVPIVIASSVWNEGINIKTLDAVINAGGYKSEKLTLQRLGRGTRTTKDKTEMLYFDFMDTSNKHLASHSLQRMAVYVRMGWLGNVYNLKGE